MQLIAGVFVVLSFFPQEKNKTDIVIKIPVFYQEMKRTSNLKLMRPSRMARRDYFIIWTGAFGEAVSGAESVSEEKFCHIIRSVLDYGVRDSPYCDFYNLNNGYQELIRFLLRQKLINEAELVELGDWYIDRGWIESVYFLDEAVPGIISKGRWAIIETKHVFPTQYFGFFAWLKKPREKELTIAEIEAVKRSIFAHWTKAADPPMAGDFAMYVKFWIEFQKRGLTFNEEEMTVLLKSFLDYSLKNYAPHQYSYQLVKTYEVLGLSLPPQQISAEILVNWIKRQPNPIPEIVESFRLLKIDFPEELAPRYRDRLVDTIGNLEDITHLMKGVEKNQASKIWKRYVEHIVIRHRLAEVRKAQRDDVDYFEIALKVLQLIGEPPNEKTRDFLYEGANDPEVHTKDLMAAYKFLGLDIKKPIFVEKFSQRIKDYNLPFCCKIELAAHLDEPRRNHELGLEIATYFMKQIRSDMETGLEEISKILDLYESLNFKNGAATLARYLHECYLDTPARRAFQIGGLGKEAEEFYRNR
ncbi:MAG: hypothetical protein HYT03_02930 [Candidatus Harrisonbacteria bacterium]|nr:hypothetical protein [Candidatus Harrisonbacteria bacterium]